MADPLSMTPAEAASKVLCSVHGDCLREAVHCVLRDIMESEVSELAGAERGERCPDRTAHRNGYRPRSFNTRVGTIELLIPRLRRGSYFPSFLEPRRRSEQALVAVVAEAYVNGVSTRKVERLVEQLGIESMSRSTVSRLCRVLDEQVQIFRSRPLAGRYPYLWLDARVERCGRRVVSGTRPWWWPTGCTRAADGKCWAPMWGRQRARSSGGSFCARWSPGA